MNKSIMMGRLVKDPQIRYSKDDTTIARFRVAIDRKYIGKDGVTSDFFPCTAFGRLAEFVEDYLFQGMKIAITGRMQNENYTNKDGDKVYGVCLMADEIEFAESKKSQEQRKKENYEKNEGNKSNSRHNTSSNSSSSRQDSNGRNRSIRGNSESNNRKARRADNRNYSRSNNRRNPDEEYMEIEEQDYESMAFD